jgi:hypothetical protein
MLLGNREHAMQLFGGGEDAPASGLGLKTARSPQAPVGAIRERLVFEENGDATTDTWP